MKRRDHRPLPFNLGSKGQQIRQQLRGIIVRTSTQEGWGQRKKRIAQYEARQVNSYRRKKIRDSQDKPVDNIIFKSHVFNFGITSLGLTPHKKKA